MPTYFCFPSTGVIRLYLSSKWPYFVSSEEKEAQRDGITCLRSLACVRQNLDLDPDRFKARLHSVALPGVSVSEYTEGGLGKHLPAEKVCLQGDAPELRVIAGLCQRHV